MKKKRTRLRGTKTAAKSEQKKLMSRIRELKRNPEVLIPKTPPGSHAEKIYSNVLKEMNLAKEQYENPPSFFSSLMGNKVKDPLAKAYGSTLTVLDSGAPVMAIARFPHGEVNYVMRGRGISKEKLIGIQNYHNRLWVRFAHLDYVKKYKFFMYVLENGIICSGTSPKYPKILWDEACNSLKIRKGGEDLQGIKIHCKSLGEVALLPTKKVSKSKDNSYSHFLRNQVAFEQDVDFEISVSTYLSEIIQKIPGDLFSDYLKGVCSDSELWNKIIEYQKDEIKLLDKQYFIMANNLVSSDEVISKISTNKIDQAIVEDILKEYRDSIVLENFTLSAFTEYTWNSAGREIVNRIDSNIVVDYNGENSLEILRNLYNKIVKDSLTSDYPRFKSLSEPLKLIDDVVRMLKSGEKEMAIKSIEQLPSNNNMTKSVSWAALMCLSATSSRAWKYTKEEQALGKSLKDLVQKLIDSSPSEYLEVLEDISSSIGLGNKLEVI